MKGRKTLAAIAAATLMTAISLPASADHFDCGNPIDEATIQQSLIDLAIMLRCENPSLVNPGMWEDDNPIWQKRNAPSCEVHDSLARKLYEKREFAPGTKPPKNQNNDATGAAWDLRNGKYDAAISKLDSFINDVMKSRINEGYLPFYPDGDPDPAAAEAEATKFVNAANEARICINQLLL